MLSLAESCCLVEPNTADFINKTFARRLYWYKVKLDITAAQCGGKAFQAFQAGAAYYCGASS